MPTHAPTFDDLYDQIVDAHVNQNQYNPFDTAADILNATVKAPEGSEVDWTRYDGGELAFHRRVMDLIVSDGIRGALKFALDSVCLLKTKST